MVDFQGGLAIFAESLATFAVQIVPDRKCARICFADGNSVRVTRVKHGRLMNVYTRPMPSQIPAAIQGQKYISLKTFRKNGDGVATPVWFGEDAGKLYVMTGSHLGKAKRIRNNPKVMVAPCTIRGVVTGPEFTATTRILPPEEQKHARQTINRKYWMARIPLIWSKTDTYFEISVE